LSPATMVSEVSAFHRGGDALRQTPRNLPSLKPAALRAVRIDMSISGGIPDRSQQRQLHVVGRRKRNVHAARMLGSERLGGFVPRFAARNDAQLVYGHRRCSAAPCLARYKRAKVATRSARLWSCALWKPKIARLHVQCRPITFRGLR